MFGRGRHQAIKKTNKKIANWRSREEGVAAIEFAMVGLPFIVMLIGIVEMSLFFASGVVLEGAASDAARMIRTGQVQNAADPVQTFKDTLCDKVGLLINCIDLQYEVLAVPQNSFSNVDNMQPKFDDDGDLISGGFTPGGASDDILVRVVYRYQFLTPFLGMIITGNPASDVATLMSTLVIKNEPYKFGE